VFVLANQRLPDAVTEDALNKPWRPIPAGRITMARARRLLIVAVPLSYGAVCVLGGKEETLLLYGLTWMYNDLGGSDEHYAVRNGIIAVAYGLYSAGAMRVASGFGEHDLHGHTYAWLAIIVAVIFTTMQVQDLKDQEGDRARGRSTAPIDFGDNAARWMVAVPVLAWSVLCPAYWALGALVYGVTAGLGLTVSLRVLLLRNFAADVLTWKLWALWLSALYSLPLVRDYSIFLRFSASLRCG
jgi:4-hydroxybenzoate polyprenyltransferase